MSKLTLVVLMGAACALGGCVTSTDYPYPVAGNPVNPAPVRGYRVVCESVPTIPNFFGADFITGCEQIIPPSTTVVVRARG
jgi:hypothetical protein